MRAPSRLIIVTLPALSTVALFFAFFINAAILILSAAAFYRDGVDRILSAWYGAGEAFDRAIVEGNVGVVREKPATEGGEPTRMVGRSDKAVYTAKNGNFELTGNPRVQQGLNIHVATSPETVMILNEAGQLQTNGPSRTEIRQAPKAEETPKP